MIEEYKKEYFIGLLDFIRTNKESDFYYTENNIRKFIDDEIELKNFLKTSNKTLVNIEKGDVIGVLMHWKSIGNNVSRTFIKLNAKDSNIGRNLITVCLWTHNCDLYAKIRKDSKFLNILKEKGFKFIGDRGREILMVRQKSSILHPKKEEKHD